MKKLLLTTITAITVFGAGSALAADAISLPNVSLTLGGSNSPQGVATAIQIVLLLTVLTLAPAILLMMTSFTRLVIVFSLLRQAIGVQQEELAAKASPAAAEKDALSRRMEEASARMDREVAALIDRVMADGRAKVLKTM